MLEFGWAALDSSSGPSACLRSSRPLLSALRFLSLLEFEWAALEVPRACQPEFGWVAFEASPGSSAYLSCNKPLLRVPQIPQVPQLGKSM